MPLSGQLDHEARRTSVPFVRALAVDDQTTDACEILTFTSEIDLDLAVASVPKALQPTLPACAKIEVRRHHDSPWGAFHIAELKILVRAGAVATAYCTGAFCDNEEATRYLCEHYGTSVRRGSIGLEKRYYGFEGRVAAAGRLVFDGLLEKPRSVRPEAIVFEPVLNLAHHEGMLRLVHEERDFGLTQAQCGTSRIRTFRADAFGEERVRLTRELGACWAKGASTYKSVDFLIDPAVPAMIGTTRVAGKGAA